MHLNRATIVYAVVLSACAAAIWGILAFGDRLTAPEDLAGKWTLQSRHADKAGPAMTIDQSGRFFQVAFDNGPKLNLRLADQETRSTDDGSRIYQLALINEPWRMNVRKIEGSEDAEVRLVGPQSDAVGIWQATRTSRFFPADVSTAKGAH